MSLNTAVNSQSLVAYIDKGQTSPMHVMATMHVMAAGIIVKCKKITATGWKWILYNAKCKKIFLGSTIEVEGSSNPQSHSLVQSSFY